MSDEKALALRLAEVLEKRRLTRWVHSTGETPRASGYVVDQECTQAAAELRRQHEEIQSLRDRLARQKVRLWIYRDNPGLTTMSPPSAPDLWEPLGPIV
jgi:hypothetical protein